MSVIRRAFSSDIRQWTNRDLVSFLQKRGVRLELVNAVREHNLDGKRLLEKDAALCQCIDSDHVGDDVVIDALFRSVGRD